MSDWDEISDDAESAIDEEFGEDVVISPYKRSTVHMADTIPDPSRQVRNTVGYRVSKYTYVRQAGSSAFMTKRTEADLLLSVREEYVPDVKDGDRVQLRGSTYDISFVEFWGNGRNVLHLLKRHT